MLGGVAVVVRPTKFNKNYVETTDRLFCGIIAMIIIYAIKFVFTLYGRPFMFIQKL